VKSKQQRIIIALAILGWLIAGYGIYNSQKPKEHTLEAPIPNEIVVLNHKEHKKGEVKKRFSLRDDLVLSQKIYAKILTFTKEDVEDDMRNYSSVIQSTGIGFKMVAIKGGDFLMGSPMGEIGRNIDEGPQRKVRVDPFWMGKYEVTWNQFGPYSFNKYTAYRSRDGALSKIPKDFTLATIVSAPSEGYMPMDFGMGKDGYPAISMTQHAANKFCQWLSAQTGHFYRLPTEAEWEYTARAGSKTAYHFGDDPDKLKKYAVYDANQYARVGTKKPNQWGLYDMHGNVLEWALDQFQPYSKTVTNNPWVKPTKLYPRVVRGGSWYDYATECRSSARLGSDKDWKIQDPLLPQSIWFHTDAEWLGFRLVRPLKIPSAEEMHEIWNIGTVGLKQ